MTLFKRKPSIPQLCRNSRWLVVSRHDFHYSVANNDDRPRREMCVRAGKQFWDVQFSLVFPIRFPLNPEPTGLFARILIRNVPLVYSAWNMDISDSCEAQLYLFAQMPCAAMNAVVFNAICKEMDNETRAFEQELRDKFRYGFAASPRPARWTAGGNGGPVPRKANLPDVTGIRYLE